MKFPRFKKNNNLITNTSKKRFVLIINLWCLKKNNFKECLFFLRKQQYLLTKVPLQISIMYMEFGFVKDVLFEDILSI